MKTWTIGVGLFLFGIASAQNIELLTPELINHGRVEEGTELEGRIRFVNRGKNPITIKRVKAGCHCTVARLDKREIVPDDTANIHYTLRTSGYSGLMRKAVTIQLDKGNPANRRFILQADVYTDIFFHPKHLLFKSVDLNPDTLVTQVLTINNTSDQPLVCLRIRADTDAIHATPAKTVIGPGECVKIVVALKPSEAGRRTYYLLIDTDHKLMSNIRIPVYVHVR